MSDDVRRAKFQRDALWNFASLAVLGVSGVALNVLISYDDATTPSPVAPGVKVPLTQGPSTLPIGS